MAPPQSIDYDALAKQAGAVSSDAPAPPAPSPYSKPGPYVTALPPDQEQGFQSWVKKNKVPFDPSPTSDYDMRGYWKAQQTGDPNAKQASNQHFPDTYKTPYHKTFSNESMYATPDAPRWNGQKLIAKNGSVVADESPAAKPTIDYDALAKQAGAVSSTPPAPARVPLPTPGGIDPSTVAGASATGMGLPGAPATPNRITTSLPYKLQPFTDLYNAASNTVKNNVAHAGQFADQVGTHAVDDIANGIPNWATNKSLEWQQQSIPQRFMTNVVAPPLAAGKSVLDATHGIAQALSDQNPVGITDTASQVFGGDPDKAKQLWNAGDYGGAAYEYALKPAAMAAATELAARGMTGALNKTLPAESPFQNNAFASWISGGVKGDATAQEAAIIARPVFEQAAQKLGIGNENFTGRNFTGPTPVRNTPFQSGPLSNTFKGMAVGKKLADTAVDIADKPMDAVMKVANSDVVDPAVKASIVRDLQQRAAAAQAINEMPLANKYKELANNVTTKRTYGDLNDLKKAANNEVELAGPAGSISEQIAQQTKPLQAWRSLGNSIRDNMYPVLQNRYIPPAGNPGYFDLADMGRREATVLDARDGVYKGYKAAADLDAPEGSKTTSENMVEGSMYKTHLIRRFLHLEPSPSGKFNKLMRRGLGEIGTGGVPESVSTVPVQQPLALPPPPGYGQFQIPTGAPQVAPPVPAPPMAQTYVGPRAVPNPAYTPLSTTSRVQQAQQLGSMADVIPERVRGYQGHSALPGAQGPGLNPNSLRPGQQLPARVRADQIGLGHTPGESATTLASGSLNPPLRTLEGPQTLTESNFQQHFGTNALPPTDQGTVGTLNTNNPALAQRAYSAMTSYMQTPAFKALPQQAKYMARQQAATLGQQLAAHQAVQGMPGAVQYQIHWTPADLGKKVGRTTGIGKRAVAYTALVPPGTKAKQQQNADTEKAARAAKEEAQFNAQP